MGWNTMQPWGRPCGDGGLGEDRAIMTGGGPIFERRLPQGTPAPTLCRKTAPGHNPQNARNGVGWHAHVFVGMFRWAKGLRTCPRRRGHATRDDPPPLPEHEPSPKSLGVVSTLLSDFLEIPGESAPSPGLDHLRAEEAGS